MSLRERLGLGLGASESSAASDAKVESKEQIIKRLRELLKNVEDVDQLSSLLPSGSSISVYRRPRAGGELELLDSYGIDNIDNSILELIKENYGGGRYAINVLYDGDYVKRVSFSVAGKPKRTSDSTSASTSADDMAESSGGAGSRAGKSKYTEQLEGHIKKLEETLSDIQSQQQEKELLSQIRSAVKESIRSELESFKKIDRSDGSGSTKVLELITSTLSPLLSTFISMVDPSKTAKSLTSLVDVAKSMGLIPAAGAAAGGGNLSASGLESRGDNLEGGGFGLGNTVDQLLKMALNNGQFMENIARVVEALRGKGQQPPVQTQPSQQGFGFSQPSQSSQAPQPQPQQSQQAALDQLTAAVKGIRNMVQIGIAPDTIAEQIINLIYSASQSGFQVVDLAKFRSNPSGVMNEMLSQFPEFHSSDGIIYKEKIISAIVDQLVAGQSVEVDATPPQAPASALAKEADEAN